MTKEEAIKIIDCYDIGFYDLSGEKIPADKLVEAFGMAVDALSAEAVQRWIPCSERLPEREGRYLVTNSAWGSWTVDVCAWIGHWHSDDKPIAWMELPEEWKGEKDETTI